MASSDAHPCPLMSSAWTALRWVPGEQQQRPVKQADGRGAPMTRPRLGFAAWLHRCLSWSHRHAATLHT